MRGYGLALAGATATFYWLPAFGRWEPINVPYEHMFAVIFFVWGAMLFRGAADPARNLGLIDFTALQGLLHGAVMAFDALTNHQHSLLHLLGDVPLHLSMFVVLGYLRRYARSTAPIAVTRSQGVFAIFLFIVIGMVVFDAVFLRSMIVITAH